MKEASECLRKAAACDVLAKQAQNAAGTKILSEIARQWRQLAQDTDRHRRQTADRPPEESW